MHLNSEELANHLHMERVARAKYGPNASVGTGPGRPVGVVMAPESKQSRTRTPRVNKYAGFCNDCPGTRVAAGEGTIRRQAGGWVVFCAKHS